MAQSAELKRCRHEDDWIMNQNQFESPRQTTYGAPAGHSCVINETIGCLKPDGSQDAIMDKHKLKPFYGVSSN
ncbi:hypothetical protein TCAL_16994 [Tigriopus californicus]|uniref:Uncharacterized protein n=1 Tax=Tigriopus californicus TaxID=6832 RepID=A0A553PGL1_TIGCA|nr:hypothetical protein TCAL_16994 [Tigriopus californicus]